VLIPANVNAQIDWQTHRLTIYGKGGPYGSRSKRRVLPLSRRVQALLEGHFAMHETLGFLEERHHEEIPD
jgi:hypothetical protein